MFPQLLHYPVSYFPCPQGHGAGPSGEADGPGFGKDTDGFFSWEIDDGCGFRSATIAGEVRGEGHRVVVRLCGSREGL